MYLAALTKDCQVHLFTKRNDKDEDKNINKHYVIPLSEIIKVGTKCDNCDALKKQLDLIKSENKRLELLMDESLKNQQRYEQQIAEYKEQLQQSKNEVSEYKQELDRKEVEIRVLSQELKEKEIELEQVKQELEQLKQFSHWIQKPNICNGHRIMLWIGL